MKIIGRGQHGANAAAHDLVIVDQHDPQASGRTRDVCSFRPRNARHPASLGAARRLPTEANGPLCAGLSWPWLAKGQTIVTAPPPAARRRRRRSDAPLAALDRIAQVILEGRDADVVFDSIANEALAVVEAMGVTLGTPTADGT